MPSKSPEQARLMHAAAQDPEFARKAGVPQKVAREYARADKHTGLSDMAAKARDPKRQPKKDRR